MAEALYRIGTVARLAGLSTHALRVWERRYGVPSPARSGGGARLYSESEVERLRLLKRAVDRGHSISQLVPLGLDELARLAGGAVVRPATGGSGGALVDEFVEAVRAFDGVRAEQILERAELALSARDFLFEMLSPLLARVGDAWAQGSLCTASEHIASALIRDHASHLLRRLPREPGAKLLVAATPAGEPHELGALLAAATARLNGYDALYLGPDLPASEIARAARAAHADLVALSVLVLERDAAETELRALVRLLPAEIDVVVGGPDSAHFAEQMGGITALESLDDFERFLTARKGSTPRAR